MKAEEAFVLFENAAREARTDPDRKKEMGELLRLAIGAAGKTSADLCLDARLANRSTIDRWLSGGNVPHVNQVERLRKYLVPMISTGSGSRFLAACLLDARYRSVIMFFFQQEENRQPLSEEQLANLLELAEKSKGKLSVEMMCTFLGFSRKGDFLSVVCELLYPQNVSVIRAGACTPPHVFVDIFYLFSLK